MSGIFSLLSLLSKNSRHTPAEQAARGQARMIGLAVVSEGVTGA